MIAEGTPIARRKWALIPRKFFTPSLAFLMPSYRDEPSGDVIHRRRVTPPHADGARLRDIERAAIERTLEETGNNQSQAARILGIARPTLIRKLKSYRDSDSPDSAQA